MKRTIAWILSLAILMVSAVCSPVIASAENWPTRSNIKTYAVSTGNDTPVYQTATSTNGRYGTIYATDLVTILGYSNNRFKVKYPLDSGGYKTGYVERTALTNGYPTRVTQKFTAASNMTVYRRASGSAAIGTIYKKDLVYVIDTKGSRAQVLYPLDAGGMKMGWISASLVPGKAEPVQATKWLHGIPVYRMADSRWSGVKIGTKTIGQVGCLICSISMMFSYARGKEITPDVMRSQLSFQNNDLVWSSVPELKTIATGRALSTLKKYIDRNKACIVGARGSWGWHYVVVTGYQNVTGELTAANFSINDPGTASRYTLQDFFNDYPSDVEILSY